MCSAQFEEGPSTLLPTNVTSIFHHNAAVIVYDHILQGGSGGLESASQGKMLIR
jgi:hypothetical protein